jgi:hypothetical protein
MPKLGETLNAEINGLYLFKSLIKDGCEWHGDVCSKKWSECLIIPTRYSTQYGDVIDATILDSVQQTLSAYVEGQDFKIENNMIWIY